MPLVESEKSLNKLSPVHHLQMTVDAAFSESPNEYRRLFGLRSLVMCLRNKGIMMFLDAALG
ncbi:hypothetical protein [Pseudomonas sp. Sample_24]|jgi:hypothetical protein|uniref:hypothetical protein n=1 Tax=Pseudomonas sp. Sample_24 TaxID=2448268 RepID=UPI001032F2D5|nr:hypothetical protein [Pseudomonas sp. Sample_24]